jgi:HlyD family secretion protein
MKEFFKSLYTNKKRFYALIIIVVLIGGYFIYKKTQTGATTTQYVTSAVTQGTITTSVSGTGQVEASDQMDIKPQTDGRITSLNIKENQQVKSGDVLAIIDQQSAANSVAQARGNLEQAQASYDKLMSGATDLSIQSQKLSIASAQAQLDQANQNLKDTKAQQQQAVDKAYSNLLNSGLSADPSDNNSTAAVTVTGNYTGTDKGSYTINLYQTGGGMSYSVSGLGSDGGVINKGLAQPIGNGLYVTFSSTGTINTGTTWTVNVPNIKSSGYLNNLDAYNTAVLNQQQSLQSAQNQITSAQNALDKANLSLATTVEPPTASDIASAKAQITSAQAQLQNAQTAYDSTILKAPFDGVIASVLFSAGDKVTAGTVIATVITKQQVAKISLNEVDAAKVKVGQKATLTFSAVPDLTLTGTVEDVDNIGTVSQNVVNFTVKIVLDTQDPSIKPGMSVTASVITASSQDVLTVPIAAVHTSNGSSYVEVLKNGAISQVTVTVGLSNDTSSEISGTGIAAGDEVVTQTITGSASKTSTTPAASRSVLQTLGGGGGGGGFRAPGGN